METTSNSTSLVVRKDDDGLYSMTTRSEQNARLLEEYGDQIFDPPPDRNANGGGSGRPNR
jgi:hypothetical protein